MSMSNEDVKNYVNNIAIDNLREELRDRILDVQVLSNKLVVQKLIIEELFINVKTSHLSLIHQCITDVLTGGDVQLLERARVACVRLDEVAKK